MLLNQLKNTNKFHRPAPFWSLNDKLCIQEGLRQIRQMSEKGWGGFFLHSRVGLITKYLSDDWFNFIYEMSKEAQNFDMISWLYDEDRWPSGFAGGEVPKQAKEYRFKYLLLLNESDSKEDDDLEIGSFEYKGSRYICVERISKLGDKRFNGYCYVDLLNKKTTEKFLEVTHEKYKEKCGEFFGKSILGVFTDEPAYCVGMDTGPFMPWTESLPEVFCNKKGYKIQEHLKELFFDVDDYIKVRFDFFDIVTSMFVENFTKVYAMWCEKNDLYLTGHFMAEDSLRGQIEWIGAAMPHYEYMQFPGVDKLERNTRQTITIKQLSSVVEQLNKVGALCETFGTIGQHTSFIHRKWIADWQATLGITYVNHHLSHYSMRGERKRDWPPNIHYQQPWWDYEKGFSEYLERLCFISSWGKRDVDILVLHPISTAWSLYSRFNKNLDDYDTIFELFINELISNKFDFHFGDEMILSKYAKVEGNKIVVGEHSYSTVILPPIFNLRKSTAELFEKFVKNGGKLLIMKKVNQIELRKKGIHFRNEMFLDGIIPNRCEGELTYFKFVKESKLFDSFNALINELNSIYPNRIRIIDKKVNGNAEKVIIQKRNKDNESIIFIANTDIEREVECVISINDKRNMYLIDIADLSIYKLRANDKNEIEVTLHPAGSMLLYLSNEEIECNVPNFTKMGAEFYFSKTPLNVLNNFISEPLNPNALLVDRVDFYINGKMIHKNVHVSKVWNDFYSLADGENFEAVYKFNVLKKPYDKVFAVIEAAENFQRILVNDKDVETLKKKDELAIYDEKKNYLDVNWTKVDITDALQEGLNIIKIIGQKYNNVTGPGNHVLVDDHNKFYPTDIEAIYIIGDFSVTKLDDFEYAIDSKTNPDFKDITRSGYPFYVGKIKSGSTFNIFKEDDKRYVLTINGLSASCVTILINRKVVANIYFPPWKVDITDYLNNGQNIIEIIFSNTLFNLLGPTNYIDCFSDLRISPRTFIDYSKQTNKYITVRYGFDSVTIYQTTIL